MKPGLLKRLMLTMVLMTLSFGVIAGARPGAEDAACDALDLNYRSTADRSTPRDMNFLLFDASAQGCIKLVSRFDKGE